MIMDYDSKGSISFSENTKDVINRYLLYISEYVHATEESMMVVLHRAGSFCEYAKNLSASDFNYGEDGAIVKGIAKLMDFSLETLKANGIEIDAQTIPQSETYKSVYVVHDQISEKELSEAARQYLEDNSLKQVLTYFIQNYYNDSKRQQRNKTFVHIELKTLKRFLHRDHSPLNAEEKDYVEQVISEVEETISSAIRLEETNPGVRKHISFVSFNLYALEHASRFLQNRGEGGYNLYFIAGTNRGIVGQLAVIFFSREINYLNSSLIKRAKESEWLTGIWFDPAGIKNMAETFNEMNRGRQNPLSFYISTYKLKQKRCMQKLKKSIYKDEDGNPVKLENVRGLIFDIRKFK